MKTLIIDEFGNTKIKHTDAIPRKGDKVDAFHHPLPVVKDIVWWPTENRLKILGCPNDIDVLILV